MYNSHGGGCCGYGHIYAMDGMSVEAFDADFARHLAAARGENRVCEVILSSRQVVSPPPANNRNFHESIVEFGGWPTFLASRGFRRGATWRNSNTDNMCYQFLHCPVFEESTETDLPILPTVTLPPSPEVHIVRTPPTFNVGDLVVRRADRETPYEVTEVDPDGVRIRSSLTNRSRLEDVASLIHAQYSTGGEEPSPVDPTLPIAVRDMATGVVYEARVVPGTYDRQLRVTIEDNPSYPTVTTGQIQGGINIRGRTWYYDRATGNFSGSNPVPLRAFNRGAGEVVRIPRPAAPAPAPEPTVILVEYFAEFRDGRTRGPFTTEEEAREAYPRVRSFFARRVLSDGSTVRVDL